MDTKNHSLPDRSPGAEATTGASIRGIMTQLTPQISFKDKTEGKPKANRGDRNKGTNGRFSLYIEKK